ncbi:MAG: 30S ribosomal protein S21 [Pandoraea sp.]|nr:30S ribosomal protein S21 [Pandoraea sp.]
MTKILIKDGEPVEVALRRFRRAIDGTGLIKEVKARAALRKRMRSQTLKKKMY